MAIVDQFGQPYTVPWSFAHAADRSGMRGPSYSVRDCSIDDLIPPHDRRTLVSISQRMFVNHGVVKGAISQKACWSVGSAWVPVYGGRDKATGDRVEAWFQNVWFPNCDVRGGVHDWHCNLEAVSKAVDREGDSFTLLTKSRDGRFPLIQDIPAWMVQTKGARRSGSAVFVDGGPYSGARIHDGIIYTKEGRALAYRISRGDQDQEFEDLPASSVIHLHDPQFSESGRGLPSFTHALDDLKHCIQSTEYERIRQLIISSIGLIEYNETGGPNLLDPKNKLGSKQSSGVFSFESHNAGTIRHFQAGSGNKLEQIKHESPGELWENFHDRMIRGALLGIGWPYSMWKPVGQGTAERAEVERARRSIQHRQRLLSHWARRVVTYVYAYAAQRGDLPALRAPMSWSFTKPPRFTVDDGREAKAQNEAYRLGRLNLADLLETDGKTLEEHYAARIDEIVKMKMAIREAEEANELEIDEREMRMLTANEVPQTRESATNDDDDDESDPDREPVREAETE